MTQHHDNREERLLWQFIFGGLMAVVCVGIGLMVGVASWFGVGSTLTQGRPSVVPIPTAEPRDKIAYVANDRQIWLVAPDGSQRRKVTSVGATYRFPIWSPNNKYLAFIGEGENSNRALFYTETELPDVQPLFDEPDHTLIYHHWSPDSQQLSYIAQTEGTLHLHRQSLNDLGAENRRLVEGNPFYWAWSPLGDRLLMHVGGNTRGAHLSLLDNDTGATRVELELNPGRFQTPLWSPDGEYIYYTVPTGQIKGLLYRMNVYTFQPEKVANLKGPSHLTISPDGTQLAYTQIERRDDPPFGSAYLVDSTGGISRQLVDFPVASMYWSPDGQKIALLALGLKLEDGQSAKAAGLASPLPQLSSPETVVRWLVYDLKTDQLNVLKTAPPTDHLSDTILYYDQYAQSLTFWSPDSRYFLISEKTPDDSTQGTIWITDSLGEELPREIASGVFATWSWR